MIVDREALRAGDEGALAELHKIVKRVSSQEARRYRASASADDIAQEVLMETLRVIKQKREDEEQLHIEGFIRKAARNRAISFFRSRRRLRSVEGEWEFDANVDAGANDPLAAVESAQSRKAVRDAVEARGERPQEPEPESAKSAVAVPRKPKEIPPILGEVPTSEELRKLRHAFGMTQKQFAKLLGISVHTLRNYEYEIVPRIPAKVVEKARAIEQAGRDTGYLAPPPFLTLARGWMRDLGLKPRDYAGLAQFLGSNRSTVWRWFNKGVTPPREVVTKVTVLVEEVVRHRELHARGERV